MTGVRVRSPDEEERHKLRHLGDGVQIATLSSLEGESLEVATWPEEHTALVGPFLATDLTKSTETAVTARAEPTTACAVERRLPRWVTFNTLTVHCGHDHRDPLTRSHAHEAIRGRGKQTAVGT